MSQLVQSSSLAENHPTLRYLSFMYPTMASSVFDARYATAAGMPSSPK